MLWHHQKQYQHLILHAQRWSRAWVGSGDGFMFDKHLIFNCAMLHCELFNYLKSLCFFNDTKRRNRSKFRFREYIWANFNSQAIKLMNIVQNLNFIKIQVYTILIHW